MESFRFTGISQLNKFDGKIESYRRWRNLVTDVVQANGIRCLIDPSVTKDKRYTDDQWGIIDEQLMGILKISLSEDVRDSIMGSPFISTLEFLKTMDKTYNLATTATKFKLVSELLSFQQKGRSISTVTNEYKAMLSNLKSIKFVLDDLYTLIYLNGLDPEYDIIRQVIQASDNIPSLDETITRILGRESEIQIANHGSAVALKLEEHRPRQIGTPSRETKKCTNCHIRGHIAKECYHEGGGAVSRRPAWWKSHWTKPTDTAQSTMANASSQENLFVGAEYSRPGRELEFMMCSTVRPTPACKNEWLIDSGCSISASHDRSVFVEYSRYTGRITVGDGRCVNIVGIGTVVIE